MYIDKLGDMVKKYNNTYHRTIKMKPIDSKLKKTDINFIKENHDKEPRFEVDHHKRISKYKNIFAKVYPPNWSQEVFESKKVENTVPQTYVREDLNGEEIFRTFNEKELKNII